MMASAGRRRQVQEEREPVVAVKSSGLEIPSPNETFSVGSEPGPRALGCPEASSRPNSLGLLYDENLGLNGPDI